MKNHRTRDTQDVSAGLNVTLTTFLSHVKLCSGFCCVLCPLLHCDVTVSTRLASEEGRGGGGGGGIQALTSRFVDVTFNLRELTFVTANVKRKTGQNVAVLITQNVLRRP